jgi:hypothetical protein
LSYDKQSKIALGYHLRGGRRQQAAGKNKGAIESRRGYIKQTMILLDTHKDIYPRHSPKTPSIKGRGTPKTYTKDYISKIIGIFFINKTTS